MAAAHTEGKIIYSVGGETFETYYKLFGSLEGSEKKPLVVLHGGPGLCHDYLLPLADLAAQRPVIFYDQVGNGRSTHLREQPAELFTISLFVNELDNLIKHLKLESSGYHLLGHSWGGMLAAEFYLALKPKKLKSMILTNSLPAMHLWQASQIAKVASLGPEILAGAMAGFSDPPKYRASLEAFHAVHGCILKPPPSEFVFGVLDQIFGDRETGTGGDPTVPMHMFGGVLKEWSIVERLPKIQLPVFVINGRADIADDTVVAPFFWGIPKVKWVTFEKSSHLPMWEERELYGKFVGEWLSRFD